MSLIFNKISDYVYPIRVGDKYWSIEGNVFEEGDIVSAVSPSSLWAYGWTNDKMYGKFTIGQSDNRVYVKDLYTGVQYILRDKNIKIMYKKDEWRSFLVKKGIIKGGATFEYGGSVGTIESRCPYTGRAERAGMGELSIEDVRREIGK
uniref:Uncharacterized protein n=1 Tax=viral metagenome TaxID=1070528 RepID=A0A6C0HYC5_9ZZZZ